jgi:uncharacterized metal-binding protein
MERFGKMPSKEAHLMMTSSLVIGFTFAGIYFGEPAMYFLAGGAAIGLAIQPDMDLKSKGYWRLYGRWAKHRGRSHAPVIGTLGRMLYLLWLPILLAAVILFMGFPLVIGRWWPYFILIFIGLCLADVCHWGLDKVDKRMGGKL